MSLLISLLETSGNFFSPQVKHLLAEHLGPFLLGGTAPDVRNISPVTREETHFYPVPPDANQPSTQTMLQTWPMLANPSHLKPDHAAFIAGYLAHLWFDEFWYTQVISPYFMERNERGDQQFRYAAYNLLIGYLDTIEKTKLDSGIGQILLNTTPNYWMPFLADKELTRWKTYLSEQLLNGSTRTVEILADRAHMTPSDYIQIISEKKQMDQTVFIHVPRTIIVGILERARRGSARIIMQYLDQEYKNFSPYKPVQPAED